MSAIEHSRSESLTRHEESRSLKEIRCNSLRAAKMPSTAVIEKLTRKLWEFDEQVRLEPLSRRDDRRPRA